MSELEEKRERDRLGPLVIGLAGPRLAPKERAHLQHPGVGGVILFTRNYTDLGQLQELVHDIRDCGGEQLLVCVDHEGGRVQRFRDEFTPLPPLGFLGRLWLEAPDQAADMAYRHARVMATELLLAGVDLSFAPVLDLGGRSAVIGDRAFAEDPDLIIALGGAYLAGMHDSGMKTTGKHFPGHGSVVPDSHVEDVCDERSFEEIRDSDMRPFKALADQLDALMMAHVVYPDVDSMPAGYSARWIDGVLRSDWHWNGTVFSDDLGMHAAKVVGGLKERMMISLNAGCDAVLVCSAEDTAELLEQLDEPLPDATVALSRLRRRRPDSRADIERVPEWRRWQASLGELGERIWT